MAARCNAVDRPSHPVAAHAHNHAAATHHSTFQGRSVLFRRVEIRLWHGVATQARRRIDWPRSDRWFATVDEIDQLVSDVTIQLLHYASRCSGLPPHVNPPICGHSLSHTD